MKAGVTPWHARWLVFAACLLSIDALANDTANPVSYPRAKAVATMQFVAARIEHAYQVFAPAFVGATTPPLPVILLWVALIGLDSYFVLRHDHHGHPNSPT